MEANSDRNERGSSTEVMKNSEPNFKVNVLTDSS